MADRQGPPRDLEAYWYQRLRDEGFRDIEDTARPDRELREWHSIRFQKTHSPVAFHAKRAYFEAAGRFLHDYRFGSDLERQVWERHCQGLSVRVIAKELGVKPDRVFRTVRALARIMRAIGA